MILLVVFITVLVVILAAVQRSREMERRMVDLEGRVLKLEQQVDPPADS